MKLTNYDKFNLAIERNKYVFPNMENRQTLLKHSLDVTLLFVDEMGKLPERYSKMMMAVDDDGPIFVLV
jgi:hypothetical protein